MMRCLQCLHDTYVMYLFFLCESNICAQFLQIFMNPYQKLLSGCTMDLQGIVKFHNASIMGYEFFVRVCAGSAMVL